MTIRRMRHCGENIGASYEYLAPNGHLATFRAWSSDGGIYTSHKQYAEPFPLPDPLPVSLAAGMAACLRSAVRAAGEES